MPGLANASRFSRSGTTRLGSARKSTPCSPNSSSTRASRTNAPSGGAVVRLAPAVEAALLAGRPVVGLESSVLAQGLPAPHNAEAARRMEAAIRDAGAEPAITAVARGQAVAGLSPDELSRFLRGDGVKKAAARDLGAAIAEQRDA